jgi:two-component system cell cycle sensor histidine kinase/response regulator CckA
MATKDGARETLDALTRPVARCARDGRVLVANRAFRERGGGRGYVLSDGVSPDDLGAVERLLSVPPGETCSVRARWLGESGSWRFSGTGLEDGVVVEIDTDDRSEDLDRMIAEQRLEALARLAGGMANDFANVLSIVINYADFALHTATDPRTVHYLEAIRSGADRAAHLTDELLLFARGREEGAPQALDIGRAVLERKDLLARVAGAEVRLSLDVTEGLPPVRLGRASLDQALMNLCTNAREALPEGGALDVAVRPITLGDAAAADWSLPAGTYVRLAVSDDGPGMTPDVRARALDPFFTTKGEHRRGLGLSVVYGMVKAAGGAMRVRSEPGAGTAVEILLPPVREARPVVPSRIPSQGNGETVLVVDDEPLVRAMTAQILLENGYDAIEAGSPEEALRLFEGSDEPCDLLLTDIIMPRMTGAQLAEKVRALRPGARVLFMSGYGTPAILAVPSVASVPLLDKPFEADTLLAAVRRALDL